MTWRSEPPASLVRFDVVLPAPAEIQRLTDTSPYFAVSPDGTRIAIVAVGGSPAASLWIKAVDAASAQMVPGTAGASSPFWSLDGRAIGFFAGGTLKR